MQLVLSFSQTSKNTQKSLEIFKIQCGNDYWVKTTCRTSFYLEMLPISIWQSKNPNGGKTIWRKIQNSSKHAWGFEDIALVSLFIKNCLQRIREEALEGNCSSSCQWILPRFFSINSHFKFHISGMRCQLWKVLVGSSNFTVFFCVYVIEEIKVHGHLGLEVSLHICRDLI